MNNNVYKISKSQRELLELLTKIVLNSVEINGSDILIGKFNSCNIKNEKNEFDKICENGIKASPEMQMSLSKYKIDDKEYYHLEVCNCCKVDKKNIDKTLSKNSDEKLINDNKNINNDKIKITKRQIELINLIDNNPHITYEEIKSILGISKGTICIDMKLLKKLKILERIGTVDGKWFVNKNLLNRYI